MFEPIKGFIFLIAGYFVSYLNMLNQYLMVTMHIDATTAATLYRELKAKKCKRLVFETAFIKRANGLPDMERSVYFFGFPFKMEIEEGFLSARNTKIKLSTPRIYHKKLVDLLASLHREDPKKKAAEIKVNLGSGQNFFQAYTLKREDTAMDNIFLPDEVKGSLLKLLNQFMSGEREKLGLILYGPPGNGKTSMVKALASQFGLDIYCPIFTKSTDNDNILHLFNDVSVEKRAIILLEDFDNVFDGRKSSWDNGFSLDALLNVVDGVYFQARNCLFIITANDISKIDPALKHRPSRFDSLIEIKNPTREARLNMLLKTTEPDVASRLADLLDGQSGAVVQELARRRLTADDDVDFEVKKILDTFQ